MQSRLMRSRTEVVIAGVCGGLGEYFAIDPVIVRLIFVLVTLTSGLGLLIYPILWLVMPKSDRLIGARLSLPSQPNDQHHRIDSHEQGSVAGQHISYVMQDPSLRERQTLSQGRMASSPVYKEVPPLLHNVDSSVDGPAQAVPPAIGPTIQLPPEAVQMPEEQRQQALYTQPLPRRTSRKSWYGFMLLGLGILVLANTLNLPTDIIFPMLLIGAGVLLLRRR